MVFGIMGDARGHLSQALALARELPEHEFLFLGGGTALELRQQGYQVEELPMLATLYKNNQVDLIATIGNAAKVMGRFRPIVRRIVEIIKNFDPALVFTFYEFFTPFAAERLGLFSMSVDNHHALTHCYVPRSGIQGVNRALTLTPMRFIFSRTNKFLITAYYRFLPRDPARTEIFPPLLPKEIISLKPTEQDHVLVYQTSTTFESLLDVLKRRPERFIIYGWGSRPSQKNCIFKGLSREGFLTDLASCRYFITNGGHNAISEALFLGKPVLSFPIHLAYEQFFNAHMLTILGYGNYSLTTRPGPELLVDFERHLDSYRARIRQGRFWGNELIAGRVRELLGISPVPPEVTAP